jgi:hypothetical protein
MLDQGAAQGDSQGPKVLVAASGTVIVGWQDFRDGPPQVLVARSTTTDGSAFTAPVRADTPSTRGAFDPRVGVTGERVVVVYASARHATSLWKDIYANFSVDEGVSFQPTDLRLDTGSLVGAADSLQPCLATTANRAYFAWIDLRTSPYTFGDVYFSALEPVP